jgi:hypothetical protein
MRATLVGLVLFGTPAFAQLHSTYDQEIQAQRPIAHLTFSDSGGGFLDSASGATWAVSGGAIAYRQTSPIPGRKAAAFSPDAAASAPKSSLGSFEWTQPFTITAEVSAIVAQGGYSEWLIAGKGNPATMGRNIWPGDPNAQGIFFYLNALMGEAGEPQACLMLAAGHSLGTPSTTVACGDVVNLGDGQPHQITATYDGSGMASGIGIVEDGIPVGSAYIGSNIAAPGEWGVIRGTTGIDLGAVSLALSGGSGYAASTPFISSGGGSNCTVTGNMLAVAGVPSGVTYATNGYCTSAPSIALVGATGSGVTLAVALLNTSIVSDDPWYLNGDAAGVMASFMPDAPGTRTVYDFAIIPGVTPPSMAQDLALYSNAAQTGLAGVCANRPNVIVVNDGDGDWDNWGLVAAAVAAHRLGCINLVGVEDNQGGTSASWYRQALDQAGLAHVPVAQTPQSSTVCGGPNTNWADELPTLCGPWRSEDALADAGYDANYIQRAAGAMTDIQMYTQVLTKYSNVNIVGGGALNGLEDLMLSPGGMALFQASVAAIYQQEAPCANSGPVGNFGLGMAASEYVLAHNSKVPVYLFGGAAPCMPNWLQGVEQYSRGPNDPWDAVDVTYRGGGDSRTPFDSWGLMALLQPGLFEVGNGPGTVTLTGTMAAGTAWFNFSTTSNSHHYWMRYAGPPTFFNRVLNSLINANPGLPVGTPQ